MLHVLHMKRVWVGGALAFAVLIGGVYYWYTVWQPDPTAESFDSGYNLTLMDYDGNEVQLSDYRRQVLVVYAWASWCPYCGAELEYLAQLKDVYGDEVMVLAVNRSEPRGEAKSFTDQLALGEGVELLLDPTDALYKDIEGYAMPEMLFIDTRGSIRFHQRGPIRKDEVHTHIKSLLGE